MGIMVRRRNTRRRSNSRSRNTRRLRQRGGNIWSEKATRKMAAMRSRIGRAKSTAGKYLTRKKHKMLDKVGYNVEGRKRQRDAEEARKSQIEAEKAKEAERRERAAQRAAQIQRFIERRGRSGLVLSKKQKLQAFGPKAATILQKRFRGKQARKKYQKTKKNITKL